MEPLFLTVNDAAALLKIGRSKTYELIRSGQLRSVKIGGSRRIPPEALREFVNRVAGEAA